MNDDIWKETIPFWLVSLRIYDPIIEGPLSPRTNQIYSRSIILILKARLIGFLRAYLRSFWFGIDKSPWFRMSLQCCGSMALGCKDGLGPICSLPKQNAFGRCFNGVPTFIYYLDVDTAGGWGPWSEWTPCSSTCADGTRNRYRFCDSPPPRYGAKFCEVISSSFVTWIEMANKCRCFCFRTPPGDWCNWSNIYGHFSGEIQIDSIKFQFEMLTSFPGAHCANRTLWTGPDRAQFAKHLPGLSLRFAEPSDWRNSRRPAGSCCRNWARMSLWLHCALVAWKVETVDRIFVEKLSGSHILANSSGRRPPDPSKIGLSATSLCSSVFESSWRGLPWRPTCRRVWGRNGRVTEPELGSVHALADPNWILFRRTRFNGRLVWRWLPRSRPSNSRLAFISVCECALIKY